MAAQAVELKANDEANDTISLHNTTATSSSAFGVKHQLSELYDHAQSNDNKSDNIAPRTDAKNVAPDEQELEEVTELQGQNHTSISVDPPEKNPRHRSNFVEPEQPSEIRIPKGVKETATGYKMVTHYHIVWFVLLLGCLAYILYQCIFHAIEGDYMKAISSLGGIGTVLGLLAGLGQVTTITLDREARTFTRRGHNIFIWCCVEDDVEEITFDQIEGVYVYNWASELTIKGMHNPNAACFKTNRDKVVLMADFEIMTTSSRWCWEKNERPDDWLDAYEHKFFWWNVLRNIDGCANVQLLPTEHFMPK